MSHRITWGQPGGVDPILARIAAMRAARCSCGRPAAVILVEQRLNVPRCDLCWDGAQQARSGRRIDRRVNTKR